MENTNQNPYTPDQVPVEIPEIEDVSKPTKGMNWGTTMMIVSICIFVVLIGVQAYFLVRNTTSLSTDASNTGPSLQQ